MKQNYCFWEQELPSEFAEEIKKNCEKQPKKEGVISNESGDGFREGGDIRKSQVSWINDPECVELIWRYIKILQYNIPLTKEKMKVIMTGIKILI